MELRKAEVYLRNIQLFQTVVSKGLTFEQCNQNKNKIKKLTKTKFITNDQKKDLSQNCENL